MINRVAAITLSLRFFKFLPTARAPELKKSLKLIYVTKSTEMVTAMTSLLSDVGQNAYRSVGRYQLKKTSMTG